MRHPLVPALLVVLALVGYALLGAVVAGASSASVAGASSVSAAAVDQASENATVSGTVTDEDGQSIADAYVLLEPAPAGHLREATGGDRNIAEYLLRIGMTDVDGVRVARTDADGSYRVDVPPGAYEVVAVTEDRAVSRRNSASVDEDETVELTVDPERVLDLDGDRVTVAPGNETTVTLKLENTDGDPVRSLAVEYGDLPDGWAVESVATDGHHDPVARTVTWDSVQPGETASVRLTVSVPDDAEAGRHAVRVSADGETHFVQQSSGIVVRVVPSGWTPTPTHTAVPGGDDPGESDGNGHGGSDGNDQDGSDGQDTPSDGTASDPPSDANTTAPGLGVGLAGLALAVLVLGLIRRTDSR